MKVWYAPLVSDVRGRFGGLVMSAWRGTRVVRVFRSPSNPKTSDQMKVRRIFQNATRFWGVMNSETRAAWVAFAAGKDFTGRNSMIAKQVPALNDQTDCHLMVGTPGDASTLPPTSATVVPTDGMLTVTIVPPTPPTGWTVTKCTAFCFLDDDWSAGAADVGQTETIDVETPFECALEGLTNNSEYQVRSFITWTAPNASVRYSACDVDQGTPAA